MITTFKNFGDAQILCDKIQDWLVTNCPRYNAIRWMEPRKHPDKNEWFVKLPAEYEKDFYPVKTKIKDHIDVEVKKADIMVAKLTADWKVKEEQIIKPIDEIKIK